MKNDIYLKLLILSETLNDEMKMFNIKINIDSLDMESQNTKEFRNIIIRINDILEVFDKNINYKRGGK